MAAVVSLQQMTLVALAGEAGSGKDFVAQHYVQPYGFYPVAFADEVKMDLLRDGKATFEELYVTKGPAIRTLMQDYGDGCRAQYGLDYWCGRLGQRLQLIAFRTGATMFVIPDARRENEIEWTHANGGVAYQVRAPGRVQGSPLTAAQRQHATERDLDGFTGYRGTIHNDFGDEQLVGIETRQLLEQHFPALAIRGPQFPTNPRIYVGARGLGAVANAFGVPGSEAPVQVRKGCVIHTFGSVRRVEDA